MPGASAVCRERPPRKVYRDIYRLLHNVKKFNARGLFELVEELSDSYFYFLSHPTHDSRCALIGKVVYEGEILTSLKQFNLVKKDMYERLQYGGCKLFTMYACAAQLMNDKESTEILGLARRMRDTQNDDMYTRMGNMNLTEDSVRLKKKVCLYLKPTH